MNEQFNLAINAFGFGFEGIAYAPIQAIKSIQDFEQAFAKAFPKRYKKALRFKKKVDDLTTEYCEELFDANIFCHDCPIVGTNCEGSNCGSQMDGYFSMLSKSDLQKKLFEVFGGRYYSFSRRLKNELLKY